MNDMRQSYIDSFLGYGNPTAAHWFVGMEEGGVNSVVGLMDRVRAWHARGSMPLEDLIEYHRVINEDRFCSPPYPLQRTWARLLHFKCAFLGLPANALTIRQWQHEFLGRTFSNSTLAELPPLPSSSTATWPYSELASSIPEMVSRERHR